MKYYFMVLVGGWATKIYGPYDDWDVREKEMEEIKKELNARQDEMIEMDLDTDDFFISPSRVDLESAEEN